MIVKRFAAGTAQLGGQIPPAFSPFENREFLGVFQQESRKTSHLIQTPMDSDVHRFCPVPDCEVVYFAADSVLCTGELTVPVWQKSHDSSDFVCSCFEHAEDTIRGQPTTTWQTSALVEIKQLLKDGSCACEARIPRGTCCLGHVFTVVKQAHSDQTDAVRKPLQEVK